MNRYGRYRDCVDALDDGWLRKRYEALPADVRASMSFDGYWVEQILDEMRTRDPLWLNKGIEPKVTFETPELEIEIRKKRPHEITSGQRLAKHGISPDFIVDVKRILNPRTGRYDNVGLPDLKYGNELKTLESTSSYNTIDSHIKSASKKSALRLYFDNTDNTALTDERLREHIMRSRRFSTRSIYVLQKDGKLRRIR